MPIEAPALVAVTGANGFIAQHCIAALLEKGYRVVGTVRSDAKVEAVRQAHGGGGAAQHPKLSRELMVPAVRGATALLEACAAMRSVKRVVHTNSFACIYDAAAGLQPAKTYTARDWSPLTYADGVSAPDAATAYRACKTAAERAAWRFVAANDKKSRAAAVGPAASPR
ncbi:NADPH-dependent methylglyoxal reductase GRE2 [Beauveria bassiana D1-5]|uniref:NADPH-dependent methylglyoxal reductase GRE2 n=1 Tax=Beauveria bassiana D1-5 TaxID=1245745 RepID=A0A0A2WEF6_BEABA|nr:NADPH-dependent methylglyoxal reductase GRE2 [Beauveria bassiana D1-5]